MKVDKSNLGTFPDSVKRTSWSRTLCQSTVNVCSWQRCGVNDFDLEEAKVAKASVSSATKAMAKWVFSSSQQ